MRIVTMIFVMLALLQADSDVKKAVFDLTTGDVKRFERSVFKSVETHTTHYAQNLQEYKAVFVIHGEAYKFFLKDIAGTAYAQELAAVQPEFATRLKALVETYDVTFVVCSAGMRSRELALERLYSFVTPVATSTSALIDWQDEGYAYVPVP
jgi:uncharacterized protein